MKACSMTGASNNPCCGVCGFKLVKNGKTTAGRTRWRCKGCGSSQVQSRVDVTAKAQMAQFHDWIINTAPVSRLPVSSSTMRRNLVWCWQVPVPRPLAPRSGFEQVIVDGTYFQGWCLLVAFDGRHVVGWQWCDRESIASWTALLTQLPAPRVIVCDGATGLRAALDTRWPHTQMQRCLFHIRAQITRLVTTRPKLECGQEILELTRQLMVVGNLDQAACWMSKYASWESKWESFLKQRTDASTHTTRPNGIGANARWWYTHRALRSARALYRRALQDQALFTWLTHTQPSHLVSGSPPAIARTTSGLEGGINAGIKHLLRAHRGLSESHARTAVEWFLNSRTAHPADPWQTAKQHRDNKPELPRASSPPQVDRDWGTALSPEEGLWIRKGWAGRYRP